MTAAAVAPELPGRHADVHWAGSEHVAPLLAAGAAVAVAFAFAPNGHEPNGQCAGSGHDAVAAGCAETGLDFVAWRFASAVEPVASANAAASAINDRMRFMEVSWI